MTALIDCNSICHRVWFSMGDLSHNEKRVGVIFGFLRQILSIAKRLNTNKFIFCWDSRSRKRIALYPTYKANRTKERTAEEETDADVAYAQFTTLRKEILPEIGFLNNFYAEGYESDDIIARITNDNGNKFVIVSTDSDLYHLLTDKVSMLTDNKKPLYTEDQFIKDYQITPRQWPMVKAMAGCSSDNVQGVKGVGDKTAIKYLLNELPSTSKTFREITNGVKQIQLNLKLVRLPFNGIKSFTLSEDDLSIDSFLKVCNQYGFQSMTSREGLIPWRTTFFS